MLRPLRSYYLLVALSVLTVINLSAVAQEEIGTSAVPLRPGPPAESKPQPPAQSKPQSKPQPPAQSKSKIMIEKMPLKEWTHSVNTANGILYYNVQTGAGAVGRIDSSGEHTTVKSYPAGSFATGWTSIVNTPNGILYYAAQTGAGAVGRIDSAGNHTTIK